MESHVVATSTDDVVSTWQLTRDAQLQNPQVICRTHTTTTAKPAPASSAGFGTVHCMGWNHNQQALACGTEDGAVALMLESGQVLGVLREPQDDPHKAPVPITSLAWGKRSRFLVTTGGQGKRPSLWELTRKERIMSFQGHDKAVTAVAFGPDDVCVASGNNNGDILLHTLHSEKPGMVLPLDVNDTPVPRTPTGLMAAGVRSLHFWSIRQPLLLAGHRDGVARVWDSTAGVCLTSFKGQHYMAITALAGSPANGKLICTAGQDRKVLLFDVSQRKLLKEIKALNPINAMCFNPQGDNILVGLKNGDCSVYDLRKPNSPVHTVHAYQGTPVRALAIQQHPPRGNSSSSSSSSKTTTPSSSSSTAPKTPVSLRFAQQPTNTSNTTSKAAGTGAGGPAAATAAAPSTAYSSSSSSSSTAAGAMAKPVHTIQPAASSAQPAPPSSSSSSSTRESSNSSNCSALPSSRTANPSSALYSIPSSNASAKPNPAAPAAARRSPSPEEEVHPPAPVEQQQQQQQHHQHQQVQPQPPPASSENNNSNNSSNSSNSAAFRWRDKHPSSSPSTTTTPTPIHPTAAATIAAAAARTLANQNKNNNSSSSSSSINSKEVAQLVESKVKDMVDDLREELARDLRGLHLELLKTSESTQAAMQGLAQTFQALVEENRGLRREVEELQQQMEMPY